MELRIEQSLNLDIGAGIVFKIGPKVSKTAIGDHIILTYTCCGDCKYCNKNETSFCSDWERDNFGVGRPDGSKAYSAVDGGTKITSHFFGQSSFAKYAIATENSVVKVDKDLKLEILAPLGCGVITGAGGETRKLRITQSVQI